MNTAAAYIRVSTDDQVEFSPDSQLKAIRKYAKEHELILPEEFVFVDEGISGRKADKRPSFQRMIGTAKLKPKPFDVILLWKFSRFARNREDSIVYKSMLRKQCGIDVVSVSEQLSEDKTSILIEALIEAMDEYYSLNLAEEVRRGMTEKFSRGGVVSQPPFGYKMGDGIFVPDERTAPTVQMIFDDFLSGIGTRQIAQKLNSMNILTTKGNYWENRTVEYVLTNPAYIGKLRRSKDASDRKDRFHENAELVNGAHQPLISKEIFDAAQEKRKEIKKAYTRYARQEPAEYMLRGIIRCDKCGGTLCMSTDHSYLQCHRYARGTCRVSHSINVKKINGIVIQKLKEDLESGNFTFSAESAKKASATVSTVSTQLDRERRKLERVKEAYEAGIDTLEEYKENKAKIASRITALEAQEAAESSRTQTSEDICRMIAGRVRASLEALQSDDNSEAVKNMILREFIERITFIKPGGTVEILYKI